MDIVGGQNLRQMWDDLAGGYGDKTALIFESCEGNVRQFSYASLNEEINRTANLFHSLGIRKGDKVALHLDNCPEFIFCWFGLAKIGAVMVPINARLLGGRKRLDLAKQSGQLAGHQHPVLSYVPPDKTGKYHTASSHLSDWRAASG
ncbi:AMP-binding protein [Aeromonas veronii]|uniref:AMP-binding protein n=1 Tax=Aeromonas veronii TaxID=654 RepID=UPI003C6ED3A9